MDNTTQPAWRYLLETGTLVPSRVIDTHTEVGLDGENIAVRADLVFAGDGADSEPAALAEWGALGFLYTLAVLSFNDAQPRGDSQQDFAAKDHFAVNDFFHHDAELVRIFDGCSRSKMLTQLAMLHAHGLLESDELANLSESTRTFLAQSTP
ncbi:hypothetical protein [Haliea sp.]|jgi:hypothetical protein|uniref:hypothetical protein n=1 Tax=Haliea sp. TaxID=1932666 RepID=UPI000C524DFE|nr:hypothetical protein [Haliea sp.]MAD65523.1 hypothetical protein [Haliea sp.]MAY91811.1 hypothetical protein [Haliea sp.]MBK40251.1 hypothetical protein [Haliea sp.]MBP68856.1 hypothetical protein [Haliea sp.]|tara:strand:+ start:7382 stop:7837 length:456 start_codon:yes stop_codon:yes gene_type:complete